MEFKGQVKAILEPKQGVSQKGEWKSQDIVIEEAGVQYPQSVVVNIFNNKCPLPAIGDFVEAHINASANEWQGKYFQKLSAWKIDVIAAAIGAPASNPYPGMAGASNPLPTQQAAPTDTAAGDDLPF